MPKASKKKAIQPKTTDKQTPTVLALKRPEPPATIADNPVKDEAISLPTTEEVVSDDAASPLPLPEKPSIEAAISTEPERSPDEEKPKKIIDSDSGTKSKTEQNDDPLIGTQIEVTPPWGGKTLVKIVGSYVAPSGDKWVNFIPISECPARWEWKGGVKRMSLLPQK